MEQNKWKIAFMIALIIILLIGGYFGFIFIHNSGYSAGYKKGVNDLTSKIDSDLTFPILENNTLSFIKLNDVCARMR